jgi:hypothetical protein
MESNKCSRSRAKEILHWTCSLAKTQSLCGWQWLAMAGSGCFLNQNGKNNLEKLSVASPDASQSRTF